MTAAPHTLTPGFARLAGAQYIIIAVAGFFAILWVPAQLTIPGDPVGTAELIAQRPGLFAAGVAGDVIMILAEVVLSVMLYRIFHPYGPVLALAAMVARLLMAAVMAAMLLPQAAVLALSTGSLPLTDLNAAQQAELAWVLQQMDMAGVWVWQLFFALHLWLLGLLTWRSGFVPRLLAGGLAIGGTGYLVDSLRAFAFPDSALLEVAGMALLGIVTLAEISFALWLLIRGKTSPAR
ncbi:MAG: DUF4386 domain-containing protein [Sulfitobacter sp.]|nr:DUF4386 domain-containing protein [Sulfitobacter sp.]